MMRRVIWLLLLCLAGSLAMPAKAEEGQKWAVIIGIDHYQHDITPLKYAEADAQSLADALVNVAGFRPENVFVFTSGGKTTANKADIAFRFDYLIHHVGPKDTLVVYFSGHGVELDGHYFLLTVESDARGLLTLQQSALAASDVFDWLGQTRAAQTLLIVDACRNNPVPGKGADDNRLTDGMARQLVLVREQPVAAPTGPSTENQVSATLFACKAGQRSFEWDEKGHGFFTYYLVEGLKGRAADKDGRVTLSSLTRYVHDKVLDSAQRDLLQSQEPWVKSEGYTDAWEITRVKPGQAGNSGNSASNADLQAQLEEERARRRAAEERARQAEADKLKAEEEARQARQQADQDRQAAQEHPDDPVLAERARKSQEASQHAQDEVARRSDLAALNARLGMLDGGGGITGSLPPEEDIESASLFVSPKPGAPYATLGAALEAAPAHAVIYVEPGVYREDLTFTRPVRIEGPVSTSGRAELVGTLQARCPVTMVGCTLRCKITSPEWFQLKDCTIVPEGAP